MDLAVLGMARDLRTNTPVVYAQMSIPDYLEIVGDEFENFSIQRRRENHKAYQRLKADIREGALLPSITLAVKPDKVHEILPIFEKTERKLESTHRLEQALQVYKQVDILDGLQRTYIMSDLRKEAHEFVKGQTILVEFWLESDIKKLIYRIIILNAGQKPMSIRHQIELLFMSLKTSIEENIRDLEIYTERENTRRRRSRKFPLNIIVSAYQAFITGSSELHKENVIANELIEGSALDSSEEEISQKFSMFMKYLSLYVDLDDYVYNLYSTFMPDEYISEGNSPADGIGGRSPYSNWLATENVFISFFAAVSQFSNSPTKSTRVDEALRQLANSLEHSNSIQDPLGLNLFERLRSGNNPRKINVGLATRRLLTNGFKEYFRDGGETQLVECWKLAAE